MIIYTLGAAVGAGSLYNGWVSYHIANEKPETAPFATYVGIRNTLFPLIFAAPFLATTLAISSYAIKHLPINNIKGEPLDPFMRSLTCESTGTMAGLNLMRIIGAPWSRVSYRTSHLIAIVFTL